MSEFKGLVDPDGGWAVVRLADIELVDTDLDGSVTVWVRHNGSEQSKGYPVGKVPIDVILRALNVGAVVGEEAKPQAESAPAHPVPLMSGVEARNFRLLRNAPDFLFWLEGQSDMQIPEWVANYVAKNPGCLSAHEKFREFLGTRGYEIGIDTVTMEAIGNVYEYRPYLNKEQITRGFFETADLAWHFAMNHYFGAEGGA